MGRLPREVFKPAEDEDGVFLYLSNAVLPGMEKPGPSERKQFTSILNSILPFYAIECLCAAVLHDGFHLILYVPKQPLSAEVIDRKLKGSPAESLKRSINSVSPGFLMKELQSSFTRWYNRTRQYRRTGSYWKQRYKCTRLTDSTALFCCIKYLEHKSKIAKLPNLTFAAREKYVSKNISLQDESFLKKPCRNWTDGLAIGSKPSLRQYAKRIWGAERAQIKRFGKIYLDDQVELYSMRQLT